MSWQIGTKWGLSAKAQQRMLQRANDLHAWAQPHGLTYYWEDPYGLSKYPFRLFAKTSPLSCYNVLAGQWKGVELYAFDYLSRDPSPGEDLYQPGVAYRTLVMVPLRGAVPHLIVAGKRAGYFLEWGMRRRVQVPLSPAQDPNFNANFKAYSEVPNYALWVLNDQIREWLTSRGKEFALELNHMNMLLIQRETSVENMEWLLDFASGLPALLSEELWQWYPPPQAAPQPGATPPPA